MLRYCANCGTEVDETAVFCPTCGQPIEQDAEASIPPAPSWPDPEPATRADEPLVSGAAPRPDNFRDDPDEPWDAQPVDHDEVTRVERRPDPEPDPEPEPADERRLPFLDDDDEPVEGSPGFPPAAAATLGDAPATRPATLSERFRERSASGPPDDAASDAPSSRPDGRPTPPSDDRRGAAPSRGMDLPITTPVTLSAWLIGAGAALAALGAVFALFDGLGSAVDLLLLLGLLGVAVSVFLASALPSIPQLRLVTLVVVLVAFGVALDRLGFGRAGAGELLLFLGTAAAAMGAVLVETGHDQPLGGPSA